MWDQTEQQWLSSSDPEELGTGLFLIPDPRDDDPKAVRKISEPDITYIQCKRKGDDISARAIKWVPHTVSSYFALLRIMCQGHCKQKCNQPGCMCDSDKQICV